MLRSHQLRATLLAVLPACKKGGESCLGFFARNCLLQKLNQSQFEFQKLKQRFVVCFTMSQFFHPYKIHPERPRAWKVEETRIPHRRNSTSRPSRRDFQRAVVVNPSFQRQFIDPTDSADEQDMEPKLMEAPQTQGPRRVTKTENITVRRECEWDVDDTKDDSLGGKPPRNRSIVLLVVVCLTSIVSLVLTLLILSGFVGVKNCSCSDNSGKSAASIRLTQYLCTCIGTVCLGFPQGTRSAWLKTTASSSSIFNSHLALFCNENPAVTLKTFTSFLPSCAS